MPNPFASNVNQGIVDQANADPLLQAAVRGDPQAKAQILAVVRQGADPYHAQFLDYQQSQPGGISIEDLSKLYLQKKTGNPNSPVYYNSQTGQFHDQQKDSALFKVAQIAPGAVGAAFAFGPALMGAEGAGGGGGAAAGDITGELGGTIGSSGGVAELGGEAGSLAGEAGGAGGAATAGDITGELAPSTGTSSGGVPEVLGGTSKAGSLFGGAAGSKLLPTLLNAGMRTGGAAYGAHAAGAASQQQQQNIQKALDLQKSLYGQSQAALMPYYQMGAGSLGRLQSFLGTQPAAPLPSGTLGNLGK